MAGGVYLFWWGAVELLLEGAFNPLLGRLLVVGAIFGFLVLSYVNNWMKAHIKYLFCASVWLITLHYYYLFYGNAGDVNWIVGSYITVSAIGFGMLSAASLLGYSIFVVVLSVILVSVVPALRYSVFLPGLFTILLQANLGLRSRLNVIKNLAASNDRFQLLFNSTFEGVMVHERGRIIDVNSALVKMVGYSRAALIGRDALEIIHPGERLATGQKMNEPEVLPYETKGIRHDGTAIDIEVRAKNFDFEGQTYRLVTVQNITDRKRAERDRITALTMAENVRVRDEFISIASHEFKTPITSLKLQTQLIERDFKKDSGGAPLPGKVVGLLSLFNRQVDRLVELVDSMLDVSRISSGRLVLEITDVDVAALVREVVAVMAPTVNVEAPERLIVQGDRSRLRQVVENLLSNAVKYGEGKPITIGLRALAKVMVLTVEDKGLGIAPESVGRIFNRFERGISARNISGLGLGLYIARQVVEAHHGSLTVKTALGEGSTFTVTIPLLYA